MINIGQYIEMAINWLTEHFASFFDALSMGIGGFIDWLRLPGSSRAKERPSLLFWAYY